MSLRDEKKGLCLCALVLLLVFSCKKDPTNLGLNLAPPEIPVGVFFTDTVSVLASTVLVNDSILTSNTNFLLLGAYEDPEFGTVRSEAYSNFRVSVQNHDFGANPVVDAVVLLLHIDSWSGDITQEQTLNVHRLTGNVHHGVEYYSMSGPTAYDPTPLASVTYSGVPNSGLLSIPLPLSFGNEVVGYGGVTNEDFLNLVRGIAIIPQGNPGALYRVRIDHPDNWEIQNKHLNNTFIRIFYHNNSNTNLNAFSYDLRINANSARYSRIIADRGGKAIASLDQPYDSISTTLTGHQAYLQAGTGVLTRLSFPNLHKMLESGNIVINKAELEVPVQSSGNFSPLSDLFLHRTGNGYLLKRGPQVSAFRYAYVQADGMLATAYSNPAIAVYSPERQSYVFQVGTYLQAVLDNKLPNHPVYLAGGPTSHSSRVDRVIINHHPGTDQRIKVKIYFTRVE